MTEKLANYAITEAQSKGRRFPQPKHAYRTDFERDRDRIIHCEAFRRLEGKTQVFTPGLDDSYRNRLTHSMEVAQIGRTIAKALNLNDTLTEAVCLAHDLGHSPFGHTGEKVLNELMADFGGFEHNIQSLRIVDVLEHPYPDFAGLNLMYETRLALARHASPYDKPADISFVEKNCSLEGQIANVADRIAYNCHDLEDGIRSRIIDLEKLDSVTIFASAAQQINSKSIIDTSVRFTRIAKAIIEMLVSDCIETSAAAIKNAGVESLDDIYRKTESLIMLSAESNILLNELEKFLLNNLYLNKALTKTIEDIKKGIGTLFEQLCLRPDLMPQYFQRLAKKEGLERTVCDYIAGMTDRFCLKMLERL